MKYLLFLPLFLSISCGNQGGQGSTQDPNRPGLIPNPHSTEALKPGERPTLKFACKALLAQELHLAGLDSGIHEFKYIPSIKKCIN